MAHEVFQSLRSCVSRTLPRVGPLLPPRAHWLCSCAKQGPACARRAGRAKIADVGLAHTVETTRIKDLEAVGACASRQVSGVA